MKCNLPKIMEQSNITTQELSKLTGLSIATIEKYCQNKIRIIHFETLNKLCKSLNCNGTDLFK